MEYTPFPTMTTSQPHYVHGYHPDIIAGHSWRTAENSASLLLPYLKNTDLLLDVGSGAGTITCDLATKVKKVTALELNDEGMENTRKTAKARHVDLEYVVCNANKMPFPDNTFDVVHVHQVLQHVPDPKSVLQEIKRVLKPGGIVGVTESIAQAFTWFPESRMLDTWMKIYNDNARENHGEPDAGKMLLNWCQHVGFAEVHANASLWCFSTPEEREYWGGMWSKRILSSHMATHAMQRGVTRETLEQISKAWREWVETPSGWMMIPHGTVVAKK